MALTFTVLHGRAHNHASCICGVAVLDDYLRQRAGQHQRDGIATTRVLIDEKQPTCIVGYCALSAARSYVHELREEDLARLPAYPNPRCWWGDWLYRNPRRARAMAGFYWACS